MATAQTAWLRLVGWLDSTPWRAVAHVLCGAAVGAALAIVVQSSARTVVVTLLVTAVLSWLAGGIGRLFLAGVLAVGVLAIFLQIALWAAPGSTWNVAALLPLLLVELALGLGAWRFAGRWRPRPLTPATVVVEVVASVAALAWAMEFDRRVGHVGADQSLRFLFHHEDNAAWVNAVGALKGEHNATVITARSFQGLGPMLTTSLALLRQVLHAGSPASLEGSLSARTALVAQGLVVLFAPLAATLPARRIAGNRPVSRSLLAWATTAAVLAAVSIDAIWSAGFLSASLATVLMVVAAYALVACRYADQRWRDAARWAVVAVAVFAAASSWIGIVPLGVAVLAVWGLSWVAYAWRHRGIQIIAPTVVVGLALLVTEAALVIQYRAVVSSTGYGETLLAALGGTPTVSPAVLALSLALVTLGWLALPRGRGWRLQRRGYAATSFWLMTYVLLISMFEAQTTTGDAHYASRKLLFVSAGVWLIVAAVDVLTSTAIGRRPFEVALAVTVAVLMTVTVQEGPLYVALQSHWPSPAAEPSWLAGGTAELAKGSFVGCLATDAPSPSADPVSLNAYACGRWLHSLNGDYDGSTYGWQLAILGRGSMQGAIDDINRTPPESRRIFVLGSLAKARDPHAWWAPLVATGAELVLISPNGAS